MKMRIRKAVLTIAVMLALGISLAVHAAKSGDRNVRLIIGKADTVELEGAVADVLVANPSIIDVGTLRANRLYVVGRAVGDTNVLAYDSAGNQLADIAVHVRMDDQNIQNTLREFFPDESVNAKTVKDNIILSGTVSSPSVSNQVRELAARFFTEKNQTIVDLMKVRGERQVMLKVKVMEVNRSVLRDLGVETDLRGGSSVQGSGLDIGDVGRIKAVPFATGTMLLGGVNALGVAPLTVRLRALESNGLVSTLAEPTLTAISGETAGFLAGGEYPVPTGKDAQGNVIIEFKQFGVSLNFTPTVMTKERIALHMSTEVSAKDSSIGVQLSGVQVDGLSVRRAETTVELGSGNTIMIAGLLKSDTVNSMNGMPGVESLPILGQLFKSKSFTRGESELLIIITPYLVDSYADPEAMSDISDAPRGSNNNVQKTEVSLPASAAAKAAPVTFPKTPITAMAALKESPKEAARKVEQALPRTAMTPLSGRLVSNLQKTYGNRAPKSSANRGEFGYLVD